MRAELGPRPAGPGQRLTASGQLGPASWAQSSGRGHRITVNGARPTGPGLTAGRVFDNRTLFKVYLIRATMYGEAGPVYAGEKKPGHTGRATRPSWATLQGSG